MRRILGSVRKAVEDFNMIQEGDKIAVGISGGKDSLALLKALSLYQNFSKVNYSLEAISIDMFGNSDYSKIQEFCKELNVPFHIVKTDIYEVLFEVRKEKNPCSLCSKMKRGALNTKATELGCNKLALGHHSDDLIETFFLSMFYEGRLSTFAPVSHMDRADIVLIRPLIYVEEKDVKREIKNLPIMKSNCPADKNTKREYMKDVIVNIRKEIPFVKKRMFAAITHPERYNLFDKFEKEAKRIAKK